MNRIQKILISFLSLTIVSVLLLSFNNTEVQVSVLKKSKGEIVVDELSLEEVLISLGEKPSIHFLKDADQSKVKIGEDLLLRGKAKNGKKWGKRISIHFNCTDCHTFTKEFSDLSKMSADDRLLTAEKLGQAYLPGSTFYGIYNRTNWYNGDYVKKYGSIVAPARDSLTNAIQVCAKYCSSGRYLENWEVEGIVHYFKSKELKIGDLSLDITTKKMIEKYQKLDKDEKKQVVETLKKSYVQAFPATFPGTLDPKKRGKGTNGNVETGKKIYTKGCVYCHGGARVTYLDLGYDKLSANLLLKHLDDYTDYSLYQIIRWGTHPKAGREQYMPMYTNEKMSDQQIEDIIAYLRSISTKK